MKSIGDRIKGSRVLSWLTQDEFAKRVGVSRRQIVYWESGTDNPSADRLLRICAVLKISVDWLLSGSGSFGSFYNPHLSGMNRQRHLSQLEALKSLRLPCYHALPEGAVPLQAGARQPFIAGQQDEACSFVYEINDRALEPIYSPGDLIYFRTLTQIYSAGAPDAGMMLPLHNRQVALVLNGHAQLRRFEVARRGENRSEEHTSELQSRGL